MSFQHADLQQYPINSFNSPCGEKAANSNGLNSFASQIQSWSQYMTVTQFEINSEDTTGKVSQSMVKSLLAWKLNWFLINDHLYLTNIRFGPQASNFKEIQVSGTEKVCWSVTHAANICISRKGKSWQPECCKSHET